MISDANPCDRLDDYICLRKFQSVSKVFSFILLSNSCTKVFCFYAQDLPGLKLNFSTKIDKIPFCFNHSVYSIKFFELWPFYYVKCFGTPEMLPIPLMRTVHNTLEEKALLGYVWQSTEYTSAFGTTQSLSCSLHKKIVWFLLFRKLAFVSICTVRNTFTFLKIDISNLVF